MELRHFRYFVAVAEELHFSRAAHKLSISQPPLSKHIQDIERRLGVSLLLRNRRRVELTDAGKLFLAEARAVLAQADHALDTGRRIALGEIGKLHIAFTATAAYTPLFPKSVLAFRQALPGVNLSLTYMTTEAILAGVSRGEVDLGLIRPSALIPLPDGVKAIPVVRDRLMLALHENRPMKVTGAVRLASLAQAPFILRPRGRGSSFYEQVYELCALAGFTPRLVQEANEGPTILSLVATDLGMSILPASLQAIQAPGVIWRKLSTRTGTLDSRVYLVHHASRPPTAQHARFIETVKFLLATEPH